MTHIYDAVVIGAGFAGVIAARDLSMRGHTVLLLEARDRIGGRTYAADACGRRLEMGGAYVHWTQPNVWRELQRHGIPLAVPLESRTCYWLADGAVHCGTPEDYNAAVAPAMTQYVADARAQFPLPFDLTAIDNAEIEKETMQDRLDSLNLSDYDRDVLDATLASLVHSYGEQGIATLLFCVATYFGDWGAFFETAGVWPIEGGTKRLIDAITAESDAELRLCSPVASIADDGCGVTVTTVSGEHIRARAAIIAVPLNALSDLSVTPELPPLVREMIERKHPVRSSKIWVRVKGELAPFTAVAPVGKHPINAARVEYYDDGDTLLMCLCSDAATISADDHKAVQTALQLFVPDIEVLDAASHDWVADRFSQGTFVMHRPGNLTEAVPQLQRPHGRIHFAGSDIAALGIGAIEGAIASGAHAARNAVAALADQPQQGSPEN